MTEKPILFSTDMVKAILDGQKTQTRRLVKPQPPPRLDGDAGMYKYRNGWRYGDVEYENNNFVELPPYQPDDLLWVRETWAKSSDCGHYNHIHKNRRYLYKATDHCANKWKPSIHMPRRAARIFLNVVDTRLEKLQDISRWDIDAEGCPFRCESDEGIPDKQLAWFVDLWESLYSKRGYGWDSNPWVWVIEFKISRGDKE